ncbi:MAG: PKD domain-containing protein [bacterium]
MYRNQIIRIFLFLSICLVSSIVKAQSIEVAILDIQNDQNFVRTNEIASASVPIAMSGPTSSINANVYGLVDQQGVRIPAQFNVVSRWGGAAFDTSLPIRWLQVVTKSTVAANSQNLVTLRRYDAPVTDNAPTNPIIVQTVMNNTTIDTGVAQFIVTNNSNNPISSVLINGSELMDLNQNSGAYVVFNGQLIRGFVSSVEFEETGQLRTILHLSGLFPGVVPTSCSGESFDLAFDTRLTFTSGEGTVLIEHDLRNRCVRTLTDDVTNEYFDKIDLDSAGWDFNLNLAANSKTMWLANDSAVFQLPATANSNQKIEQQRGNVSNPGGWRRAIVQQNGNQVASSVSYQNPIAALSNTATTVAIQIPWMQYREPQALSVTENSVNLEFISSTGSIGEAQARWNFGLVSFNSQSADSNYIQSLQQNEHIKLSRALLVHSPAAYTNSTGAMSRLPVNNSLALQQYRAKIDTLHDETINIQWNQTNYWGAMLWPESIFGDFTNTSPNVISMDGPNFWGPDRIEVLEWFRTGEPKWFWDYAFMKQQLFLKTSVINSGRMAYNYRNGLTYGAGGQEEGGYYRYFRTTTDDKQYVMGMDEGFLIRPSGALQDVFEAGGRTVDVRYTPNATDVDIEEYRITRQTIGYYLMPLYCVMFSQDPVQSATCQNALNEIMNTLTSRHLSTGLLCSGSGNTSPCLSDQLFMHAAMHDDFFRGFIDQFPSSPYTPAVRQAIINNARIGYQFQAGGTNTVLDMDANNWETNFQCMGTDFNTCQAVNTTPGEPVYTNARSVALNMFMRAYELDNSLPYCNAIANALVRATEDNYIFSDAIGWDKIHSQGMYLIHALGVAETCGNGPVGDPVANAGADQNIIDTDSNGVEPVTLDGSGSTDNGMIVSYVWSIPGLPNVSGVNPTVNLPIGNHTITLTVTDDTGATGSDEVVINVNTVTGNPPGIPATTYTPMANEEFTLGFWFNDPTPQIGYANLLTTNSFGDTSCGSTDFGTIRFYIQLHQAGIYSLVDEADYTVHEDGGCGAHDNNRFGIPAPGGTHNVIACVSQLDFSQNYCTNPLMVNVISGDYIFTNGFE